MLAGTMLTWLRKSSMLGQAPGSLSTTPSSQFGLQVYSPMNLLATGARSSPVCLPLTREGTVSMNYLPWGTLTAITRSTARPSHLISLLSSSQCWRWIHLIDRCFRVAYGQSQELYRHWTKFARKKHPDLIVSELTFLTPDSSVSL